MGVPMINNEKAFAVNSYLVVNPIPGLPKDFIRGVDASEAPWILELGGKYYDENGAEKDLLDILVENGVNWVRLRLWNDPYDDKGNPLGGGNCDLRRITDFAAKAKSKGLKILLNFHYSDWWADPSKQNKPKAWTNLPFTQLVEVVYSWTKEVLLFMKDRNALPDMVQVGNEINNGFLWPEGRIENWDQFTTLLKSAIRAVREVDSKIKIVVHLAGVKADFYEIFVNRLLRSDVDFDVIAISFYPYWHGTMAQFRELVKTLAEKFNKGIIVAETAYAWTLDDADGHPNLFGSKDQELQGGYKASVQGQTTFIRDLMEVLFVEGRGNGLGIFYWGATWISYPGAGWKTNEGNPWENQALFDFKGRALPSLKVFKLVYEAQPIEIKPLELYDPRPIVATTYAGAKPWLPSTVLVVFTDHSIKPMPVDWGAIPVYSKPGNYTHKGVVVNTSIEVLAQINVLEMLYIEIRDPEEDDRGIGTYGYPTAGVYKPGVFDIVKTTFEVLGEDLRIRVYFRDLGGNPWNGPNGFSLQYIHIYVRTTNPVTTNRIFRKDTFGLNIEFREDYQWQYALLISPGWGEKPLVEGELSALYYSNGVVFVEDKDFKVTANLDENYVEVIVPRQLMPDWENIRYWRVIVFVTSWAGENPDRIRSFAPGGGEWICDTTKYAESAEIPKIAAAVLVGVLPKFYDMAVYSDEFPEGILVDQQYSWSKRFDPSAGSLAVIPPPKVPTVTITQTITKAMTLTYISYITETKFTPTSVYVKELDVATTVLVAVVSIAVGIIAGYLISRKK